MRYESLHNDLKLIFCALICTSLACGSDTKASRESISIRLANFGKEYKANPADSSPLDEIRITLKGNWSFARMYACTVLGDLGPLAEPAVPDLLLVLKSGDKYVEREAARALGNIGPGAKDAIPDLIKMLERPNVDVSWFAAESLGKIGKPAMTAIPQLRRASQSDDELLAEFAQKAIEEILDAKDTIGENQKSLEHFTESEQ